MLDVRGFDPLAKSYVDKETETVSDSVGAIKTRKYSNTGKSMYPNIVFKPFIFDTLGGLSKTAASLIKRLATKGSISGGRDPEALAAREIDAISVSIQCDNAAIIHRSFADARP